MKKVLILFGKSDWKKAKPFSNKDYQYSYEYFYSLCKNNGIQMYRASYQWYDYEKHIFKYAWIYNGEDANWEKVENIEPDLIYDKTKARTETYYKKELINEKYDFINDLDFTKIVDDKFVVSLLLDKWSKKNWIIKDKKDLKDVLHNISTNKVVIKPLSESGGKDVQVLDLKEALGVAKINQLCIVQDFIDSSNGVPDVSKDTHDLRIVFVNNKMIYSYIREPQKGSYLANLAQGGTLKIVPLEKLPQSVNPIIEEINKVFQIFSPRIFCLDLMFDENGQPWIVELNSMPGLYFTPEEKPHMLKMYKELLKVFREKLKI